MVSVPGSLVDAVAVFLGGHAGHLLEYLGEILHIHHTAMLGNGLDLQSKVTVRFVVDCSTYTGDVSKLSLQLSYVDITGEQVKVTVKEPKVYLAEKNYYAFDFDGLLAAELRTVVAVQVYSGNTPLSATLEYSADTYGNNKTGALLDLCKALFAYSDSAKAYFG